jgi:hypothetical protein
METPGHVRLPGLHAFPGISALEQALGKESLELDLTFGSGFNLLQPRYSGMCAFPAILGVLISVFECDCFAPPALAVRSQLPEGLPALLMPTKELAPFSSRVTSFAFVFLNNRIL